MGEQGHGGAQQRWDVEDEAVNSRRGDSEIFNQNYTKGPFIPEYFQTFSLKNTILQKTGIVIMTCYKDSHTVVCTLWGIHITWKQYQEVFGFPAYEEVMALKEK